MAREYKIGERFECFGFTYETVEDELPYSAGGERFAYGTCHGCAFYEMDEYGVVGRCVRPDMLCDKAERSDGKGVKFKAVE